MTWNEGGGGVRAQRRPWTIDIRRRRLDWDQIIISFRLMLCNQRIVSREISVIDQAHESLNWHNLTWCDTQSRDQYPESSGQLWKLASFLILWMNVPTYLRPQVWTHRGGMTPRPRCYPSTAPRPGLWLCRKTLNLNVNNANQDGDGKIALVYQNAKGKMWWLKEN